MLAREDPSFMELANRVHTLFFLGTPHRGSDLAKSLANILKISYGPKQYVSDLRRNSGSIAAINDSFRHHVEDVQLWSFYEALPSNLLVTSALIVDKVSATLGYAKERTSLLTADHRGIVKFDLPSDPNYKTLRNAFITTIDSILSDGMVPAHYYLQDNLRLLDSQTSSGMAKGHDDRLTELTGVAEPPLDNLLALEDVRVDGSCEWLTMKDPYISWSTPWSNSPSIFCLTGIAASGKSVLCSRVITDLLEQRSRCSYFFFKQGNATKSTIAGCLMSLAYQMAMVNDSIMHSLLNAGQNTSSWDRWDEKMIWRKLFIGCIFKETNPMPQYWVLDALDECQKYPIVLTFLAQIPSWLRVFITSRNTPEVEQGLGKLKSTVTHYEIQPEDTIGDLKIFVESKMDQLPADDEEGQLKMKNRILEKASGSFLWVSLVVQELEQTYSEEGAEEVLNEVPTDMDDFYAKMLENVPKNDRPRRLAKSIFMWTLSSLRALSLDEMQHAIKLDTGETVHHLDRTINAICGQLIYVDQSRQVQTIHQTAKVWLLHQDVCPDMAIDKAPSHSRIAELCLRALAENLAKLTRFPRKRSAPSSLPSESELTDYACIFFSDHLQKCASENSKLWKSLWDFLHTNILSWIEQIARTGRINHITRTATNLQAYLVRRAKYLAPFSPEKEEMEAWINDLIRLSARFRTSLTMSPSSIHTLIPALCPTDSIISKTFASRPRGLVMDGLLDQTWPDCLGTIDYPNHLASAVAHGDQYLAVAVSDGAVFLYYRDALQALCSFSHGKRVTILAFSSEDQYLATASPRMIKVWKIESQTMLWTFNVAHQTLAMLFIDENTGLAAAAQGNCVITWDLQEGIENKRWRWTDSIYQDGLHQKPRQPPGKALFSQDFKMLAACYRGLPVYLFDVENEYLIGCCSKERNEIASGAETHYAIDALAFNPNSEINVLIVSYGDGELAIFDIWSSELLHSMSYVFAHSLACSPDGRTLITGSSRGIIEIYEFAGTQGENLSLIYRINAYEDGIRGIAFSSDSLRFADIRGSQFRIWEPAVLARSELDEGSLSELSQAVTLAPKSVSILEGPIEAEITTLTYEPSGSFVFCGKQDGTVVYSETQRASERGVLYRHAANVAITYIAYNEERDLLATADESGRVIVKQLGFSKLEYQLEASVGDIRSDESMVALLYNVSGTRILLHGTRSVEVWTVEGEQVGTSIPLEEDKDLTIVAKLPDDSVFMFISSHDIRTFSWDDATEMKSNLDLEEAGSKLTDAEISPTTRPPLQPRKESHQDSPHQSSSFAIHHHKPTRSGISGLPLPSTISIFSIATTDPAHPHLEPLKVTHLDNLACRIVQIVAVTDSALFFIDSDLWVCSLDLKSPASIRLALHRHFFLLSDWRSSNRDFIIVFIPSKREFVIARKHGLLVVRRGLEFSEPWIASGFVN